MNCKPGDLAIVVRSEVGNEGRIVRVVGPAVRGSTLPNGMKVYPGDDWVIEGRLKTADENTMSLGGFPIARWVSDGREVSLLPFPDAWLRPIRDNDGSDETLTWADKPQPVEVA